MAELPLGMLDGKDVAHRMINRCLARCGRWNREFRSVASLPAGARMCKRCTRLDGVELECGHDASRATLRKDGEHARCYRCDLDVKLIREVSVARLPA